MNFDFSTFVLSFSMGCGMCFKLGFAYVRVQIIGKH